MFSEQIPEDDKEITNPLEYAEEKELLAHLNERYRDFWTFATHTGLREQAQTALRWEWQVELPMLDSTAFIIPREHMKFGKKMQGEWLLVLNSVAAEIINRWKEKHPEIVFPTTQGNQHYRFRNTHFKNARKAAGLEGKADWHSARATFATRLRAAKVGEEDREYLLAHKTGSVTTQYSWAEIKHLIDCVEKLCDLEAIDQMSVIFRLDSLKPKKK